MSEHQININVTATDEVFRTFCNAILGPRASEVPRKEEDGLAFGEGNTLFIIQKRLLTLRYGIARPEDQYTMESLNAFFPPMFEGSTRFSVTAAALTHMADMIICEGEVVKCRGDCVLIMNQPVSVISALVRPHQQMWKPRT